MVTSSPHLRLYIDTNIFLDHFLGRIGKSTTLLRQIAAGQFDGITSHFALSEITGVLKECRLPHSDITRMVGQIQAFPNIQIVIHDQSMFLNMPNSILSTCVQCRDALHFTVAKYMAVDRIVTRDGGFRNAVNSVIQCVTPEQLIP